MFFIRSVKPCRVEIQPCSHQYRQTALQKCNSDVLETNPCERKIIAWFPAVPRDGEVEGNEKNKESICVLRCQKVQ